MTSANHPPQPPTKRQDAPQVAGDHHATPHATNSHDTTHDAGKTRDVTSDVTKIQPLQGSLYAVGASHVLRIANSEFGISINQFDNHRNRFFDVIDRVQWVETDGEIVQRLILDVRGVIVQIGIIDIVFSLDSVITAVGLADQVPVMVLAIVISVAVMMFAARPIGEFVDRHPTIKMLALAFLVLVGVTLIAEGFETHVPKGYIYFAMAFSIGVEMLNIRMRDRRAARAPIQLRKQEP